MMTQTEKETLGDLVLDMAKEKAKRFTELFIAIQMEIKQDEKIKELQARYPTISANEITYMAFMYSYSILVTDAAMSGADFLSHMIKLSEEGVRQMRLGNAVTLLDKILKEKASGTN